MTAPPGLDIRLIRTAAMVLSTGLGWPLASLARRFSGAGATPRGWMSIGAFVVGAGAASGATSSMILIDLALGWVLLVLAAVDLQALRLPDVLTLPLAAAGLAWNAAVRHDLAGAGLGWLAGYTALAAVDLIYVALRGRTGIGRGDAKLFGAAGAWLGVAALPATLLVACAGALALVAVGVLARGRTALSQPIAFGAPLAGAFWTLWLAS